VVRAGAAWAAARAERGPVLATGAQGRYVAGDRRLRVPAGILGDEERTFTVGSDAEYDVGLGLKQVLFAGGAIGARIEMARCAREAAASRWSAAREDLCLAITRAAFDCLKALRQQAVAEQAAGQAAAHVRQAEELIRGGLASTLDRLEAEVRAAEAERARLAGRHAAELALCALNRVLGRPLDTPADVAEASFLPAAAPAPDECRRTALARRTELEGVRSLLRQARAGVRLARSGGFPTVTAGTAYHGANDRGFTGEFEPYWDVGATLSWNVWDAGRRRGQVREAEAAVREQEHRLRAAEAAIELEVEAGLRRVAEQEHALTSLGRSRAAAAEALRLARERFAAGNGRGLDALDAQTLWSETERQYQAARFDLETARAELLHAMGVLSASLP
jgi:outer membrane protein TolC